MPSLLRFGIFGDRSSRDHDAIHRHHMMHMPCDKCDVDQWNLLTSKNQPFGDAARQDLMLATWRYMRRTRSYLFFQLIEPEKYPDREGQNWVTPRTIVIPVDIVWALVSQRDAPIDPFCIHCDCYAN